MLVDLDNINPKDLGMELHPLYGWYIPGEAEGAIPNGTVIEKTWTEEGDLVVKGELGEVLSSVPIPSSIEPPEGYRGPVPIEYFYFVVWLHTSRAVGVISTKIGIHEAE